MLKMKYLLTRKGTTLSSYEAVRLLQQRNVCGGVWNDICDIMPEFRYKDMEICVDENYEDYMGSEFIKYLQDIMEEEGIYSIWLQLK